MESFKVIPAMDLMDGRCVRLVQGDYQRRTTYTGDPPSLAEAFLAAGLDWLHVVDLDGARAGHPVNLETVALLAATGRGSEMGGGLRTADHSRQGLDRGAQQVLLGYSLLSQAELLPRWLSTFPSRLVAGVDARNGRVAVHGWQDTTTTTAKELVVRLEELGFDRLIYTDIQADGTLQGPDIPQLRAVARATHLAVTASGGIGSVVDIQAVMALQSAGVTGVIVGKAFYEGRISLEELAAC